MNKKQLKALWVAIILTSILFLFAGLDGNPRMLITAVCFSTAIWFVTFGFLITFREKKDSDFLNKVGVLLIFLHLTYFGIGLLYSAESSASDTADSCSDAQNQCQELYDKFDR